MYRYCRRIHRFEWFIERCCMFHPCAHLLIHMRTDAPNTFLSLQNKTPTQLDLGKNCIKERRRMFRMIILNNSGSRNCERGCKKHEIFCVPFGAQLFHEIIYSPRVAIPPFRLQGHYDWKVTRDKHFGPNVCFCYGFTFLNINVLWINVHLHGNSSRQTGKAWHIIVRFRSIKSLREKN